ncbi:MAG: hypothetical protein HC849_29625 [Oscillatoriales cyanobacterium RU_3_3]|nr:hypothetical protein [Microcoleus sp. SU_5_6]NJL66239.1 hypothetical protein [Microcoleus sp. SM1_3_4]NJM63390.1 hypothetical protein [Oscillatoriales cyanobacterium RU_3_3]NJR22934.1 hypothetical protein [Richelia sp. CSU_2_1]
MSLAVKSDAQPLVLSTQDLSGKQILPITNSLRYAAPITNYQFPPLRCAHYQIR